MESIWSSTTTFEKRKILENDIETEAVVIGAGLAGILTAFFLCQRGIDTVVLEADRIAGGQTKGTTAKITSQHNVRYSDMIQAYGVEKARHYASMNEWAIGEYERIIEEKKIACDFLRCPAHLYTSVDSERLKREAEAAKFLGIKASYETDCELPFPVRGVLRFEDQARFHPLWFLQGIEKAVEIYEQSLVEKVEHLNVGDNRVYTERGSVLAKHVVFACHFPFVNLPGYYFARMHQSRSYVIAFEHGAKLNGYYLGIDEDGLSLRNEGDLLLVGGGSHRTGENAEGGKYADIRLRVSEMWKDATEVARWSAQDCMTLDEIPYIGQFDRKAPDWYVATGFGKWGMTSSMVSAKILSGMIAKEPVIEADIFSPQRKIIMTGVKELMKNGGKAVENIGKQVLSVKRTASYTTEEQSMDVSIRCPHMGCKLAWNPDDLTWECPCHGSRFDAEGNLLDHPAKRGI